VANTLHIGRQAAVRMLDSMVADGIAQKDESSKRYRLALKVYEWGARAVLPYLPPLHIRHEIARLAEEIRHPVFYCVLDGSAVFTLERTDQIGSLSLTAPNLGRSYGRSSWASSCWGKAIVAFQSEQRIRELLEAEGSGAQVAQLRSELETARLKGYAELALAADRLTLAAPILDSSGYSSSAMAIGVNNFSEEQHEALVRSLTDAASRASYHSGYSPLFVD
jgi:DNA-binding IclR family transcriptional regulator